MFGLAGMLATGTVNAQTPAAPAAPGPFTPQQAAAGLGVSNPLRQLPPATGRIWAVSQRRPGHWPERTS